MSSLAISAALLSALLHAIWNATLKSSGDRDLDMAMVAVGWCLLGGAVALLLGLPPLEAWPYLGATAAIHLVYWIALSRGYEAGELSHVYTLSRGLAPLLVALGGIWLAAETPGRGAVLGIVLVCVGVLCVGASRHAPLRASAWALAIALCISAYSLVDALGARLTGNAVHYAGWMLLSAAVPMAGFVIARRGVAPLVAAAWRDGKRGVAAGLVSGIGYGIVLYAQTLAPIAQVTALRETSVVFAAVLSAVVLRERLGARRWAGALLVTSGAIAIALT